MRISRNTVIWIITPDMWHTKGRNVMLSRTPLWEKIKGSAPEAFMAWRDCGLIDEDGRRR